MHQPVSQPEMGPSALGASRALLIELEAFEIELHQIKLECGPLRAVILGGLGLVCLGVWFLMMSAETYALGVTGVISGILLHGGGQYLGRGVFARQTFLREVIWRMRLQIHLISEGEGGVHELTRKRR